MEEIHIKNWKSKTNYNKIISKLSKIDFTTYFCPYDVTRLNYINLSDIINELPKLYELYNKIAKEVYTSDTELISADIVNNFGGGSWININSINKELCLISYFKLPLRFINDSEWSFNLPLNGNFNKTDDEICIIIPLQSCKFILLNKIMNDNNNNIDHDLILFPGKIKFTELVIENIKYNVGIYETLSLEEVITNLNNPDIFGIPANKDKIKNTEDVIQYLIDFHTQKVQIGYFAPESNSLYKSFIEYGQNFRVDSVNSSSYYEKFSLDNKDIFEFEDLHLPLESFLYKKSPLLIDAYIRESDLDKIIIPANLEKIADYTKVISVDVSLIDLNFMWILDDMNNKNKINRQILNKKNTFYSRYLNEKSILTDDGKFYLSPQDKQCLYYLTHLPNMFYIFKL